MGMPPELSRPPLPSETAAGLPPPSEETKRGLGREGGRGVFFGGISLKRNERRRRRVVGRRKGR